MKLEQLKRVSIYVLGVILFCILVYIFARLIIRKSIQRRYNIVLENSRKIPRVLELNEHFSLFPLSPVYTFTKQFDSFKQYGCYSRDDCLLDITKDNIILLKELVDKATQNKETMLTYEEEYDSILKTDTEEDKALYDKYKFFKEIVYSGKTA